MKSAAVDYTLKSQLTLQRLPVDRHVKQLSILFIERLISSFKRARVKSKKNKRNFPFFLLSKRVCVCVCVREHKNFHIIYEDPLTSGFSVGLLSLVVGLTGFLFRKPAVSGLRFPRSRWAFGGGPLADEFVELPGAVAVADCCCDDVVCDCWADDFSFAFTSTDAVEVLLLTPLLLVVLGPALL